MKLQNPNGTTLQTTTTDGNGNYNFTGLQSDSYKIMFGSPSGFNPSPQTGFGDNDVDNNSDNNPNNGNMTDVFFCLQEKIIRRLMLDLYLLTNVIISLLEAKLVLEVLVQVLMKYVESQP